MKSFVVCKIDKRCPVCNSQLTMTYYGDPDDIKYNYPENSFSFCWKCNEHPETILKQVRGILLLGETQT